MNINEGKERLLLNYIERAHRTLNRMGIPQAGEGEQVGMSAAVALIARLKTVKLYMDARRGKWLREKKKSAAANRELEKFRSGQSKSWRQKAEAYEVQLRQAMDHFRQRHLAITSNASSINQVVTYLVDRSNQLFANDSVVEKTAIAEKQAAYRAKLSAEARAASLERVVSWYQTRYGPVEMDELTAVSNSMAQAWKESDSFPWKRGNPGYLGDYTVTELLHEVEMRYAGLDLAQRGRNAVEQGKPGRRESDTYGTPEPEEPRLCAVRHPLGARCCRGTGHTGPHASSDGKELWEAIPERTAEAPEPIIPRCHSAHSPNSFTLYRCDKLAGHTGQHSETLGGLTTAWENDRG